MIEFLDNLVQPIFADVYLELFIRVLGICVVFYLLSSSYKNLNAQTFFPLKVLTWLLVFAFTIYIGCRPIECYADTKLYTTIFNLVQSGKWKMLPAAGSDVFFTWLEYFCLKITTASGWLLIIATFYVLGMAISARIWTPNSFFVTFVFIVASYSFLAYAWNGIRNGMATSLCMLGMALLVNERKSTIFKGPLILTIAGFFLLYLSTLTHRSCLLIVCGIFAATFIKSPKTAIYIWLTCIVLSFPLGGTFQSLMGSLSGDGRMQHYATIYVDDGTFSNTGFRWDFLLYSAVPIALGWYAIIKKGVSDATYEFILKTYIYVNCAWVMVNEMAYSNRFAYLSWFLYPILLAYPLLRLNIFKRQGVAAGLFLAGSLAFNYLF